MVEADFSKDQVGSNLRERREKTLTTRVYQQDAILRGRLDGIGSLKWLGNGYGDGIEENRTRQWSGMEKYTRCTAQEK